MYSSRNLILMTITGNVSRYTYHLPFVQGYRPPLRFLFLVLISLGCHWIYASFVRVLQQSERKVHVSDVRLGGVQRNPERVHTVQPVCRASRPCSVLRRVPVIKTESVIEKIGGGLNPKLIATPIFHRIHHLSDLLRFQSSTSVLQEVKPFPNDDSRQYILRFIAIVLVREFRVSRTSGSPSSYV